jgi:(1->4)-alpha-D-glucan 1-alpha-D-glucosylmutase
MVNFRIPVATYRIQFNQNCRFADARDLVPYLHEAGISDLYASPRFKARRGSSHGYDVANPMRINSELGTEQDFDELCEKLKHYEMGLLLDIVPNHMAASYENPWWLDVLENGPSSMYADYFDIDWHPATLKAAFLQENRVLLPVLGDLYGNVLENQELMLKVDEGGFFVRYWDIRLPLDPKSYRCILSCCLDVIAESRGNGCSAYDGFSDLIDAVDRLPERTVTELDKIA